MCGCDLIWGGFPSGERLGLRFCSRVGVGMSVIFVVCGA